MMELIRTTKNRPHQVKRKHLTIYGLEGFQTTKERIKLYPGVVIKKGTEKFHEEFWTKAKSMGTRKSLYTLKENKYFLHHNYEAYVRANLMAEHDFGERLRQMFRCFQGGGLDIQFFQNFFYREKVDYKSAGFGANGSNYWIGNKPYIIDDKNVKFLKNFASRFLSYDFNKAKSVDVALRRLDYSYDRRDEEDQVIDLMIGFEALFSEGGGEITFKLSLRTATFLSEFFEKDFVLDFIKKSYSLRSSIVHGAKTKQPVKIDGHIASNKEIVQILQTFLRLAIQKIIFNSHIWDANYLIPLIDGMILPKKKN